jgi:protein gp37
MRMSADTAISWCDHTFNPWWGCTKVSPACDHCYAERASKRFAGGRVLWGVGSERRIFDVSTKPGAKHWADPLKWAKTSPANLGRRPRVFCASMGDWLDLDAPLDEFVRLLDLIRRTPELDWLLLSKRIGNWRKRLTEALPDCHDALKDDVESWLHGRAWPNVWLGATVINQEEADRDVPKLLAVPARVRFLSLEPLLGPIDLRLFIGGTEDEHDGEGGPHCVRCGCFYDGDHECPEGFGPRLDWIIAGGESGPHARPAHPEWIRSLRDQCAAADVPFHFKQWGEWGPTAFEANKHKGPSAAQVGDGVYGTTFGEPGRSYVWPVQRHGKAAAGRLLDGVEHNGFPS